MEDRFSDLQKAIYINEEEYTRFRELLVNFVMATDISDKELKKLRNQRWRKAFPASDGTLDVGCKISRSLGAHQTDAVTRKATIVIEHLIQASDISHAMQHWQVYRKWNERLVVENARGICFQPVRRGPRCLLVLKGELVFFDYYSIPLAQKLRDCGVFGVSSGGFLNYSLGVAGRRGGRGHGGNVPQSCVKRKGWEYE